MNHRGQHYTDLMPGGDRSAKARVRSLELRVQDLETERATLRGQVDALRGELAGANRSAVDEYERGRRDGERLRGLTSIIAR